MLTYEGHRLYRGSTFPERPIRAMGGHEDGVSVFRRRAEEAGCLLLETLAQAYQRR